MECPVILKNIFVLVLEYMRYNDQLTAQNALWQVQQNQHYLRRQCKRFCLVCSTITFLSLDFTNVSFQFVLLSVSSNCMWHINRLQHSVGCSWSVKIDYILWSLVMDGFQAIP